MRRPEHPVHEWAPVLRKRGRHGASRRPYPWALIALSLAALGLALAGAPRPAQAQQPAVAGKAGSDVMAQSGA